MIIISFISVNIIIFNIIIIISDWFFNFVFTSY